MALSAIEDALNVRDTPRESPPGQRRDPALTAPVEREEPVRRTRPPQLEASERRSRFDRAPVEPVFEDTPRPQSRQ